MADLLVIALALIALVQNFSLRRVEARLDVLESQKWMPWRDV